MPDGITTVALGTGVTETTFTGAAMAGSGYTEICDSSPPERNISDVFTYAGRGVRVPLNACSPPLRVHAGDLTIHEMFRAGLTFGTCRANPERLLLRCNQRLRTAVIAIVPGNVSTQTIARFVNT